MISRVFLKILAFKLIFNIHDFIYSKDKANPDRFKYLYSGAKRMDKDGYNSLKYKPVSIELKRLYTWILVDLPHV